MATVPAEPECLILWTQLWSDQTKRVAKPPKTFPRGCSGVNPDCGSSWSMSMRRRVAWELTAAATKPFRKHEKRFSWSFSDFSACTENNQRHLEGNRTHTPRSQSLYGHTSPVSLAMLLPQHSPQPALHCSLAEITTLRPNNYILHNVATSQTNKSFLRKSTCLKLDLP